MWLPGVLAGAIPESRKKHRTDTKLLILTTFWRIQGNERGERGHTEESCGTGKEMEHFRGLWHTGAGGGRMTCLLETLSLDLGMSVS